jgi:hypothetical protein
MRIAPEHVQADCDCMLTAYQEDCMLTAYQEDCMLTAYKGHDVRYRIRRSELTFTLFWQAL